MPRVAAPLQRGTACICCRKRKLKCDGTRPICRQCAKYDRAQECEYDDKRQKSRTQKLREKLAALEDRIRELESGPPLTPMAPMIPSPETGPDEHFPLQGYTLPLDKLDSFPSLNPSSIGSTSLLGISLGGINNAENYEAITDYATLNVSLLDAFGGVASALKYPSVYQWNTRDPPPADLSRVLIRIFLDHRHQSGFDIDITRFDVPVLVPTPSSPHGALINAIYLLGCHYSQNSYLNALEATFLTRALHEITVALDNSDRLVDIVQASCLLAVYLYATNRPLEGYCHSFAAARLAVGLGLHQISVHAYPSLSPISLPPPKNIVELNDRISVFWQVFVVDRCWAVANGLPIALPDGDCRQTQIKTPWPSGLTYTGVDSNAGSFYCIPVLRSKVSALYERTFRISSTIEKDDNYWTRLSSLKASLDAFIATLPFFIGFESWRTEAPFIDTGLFMIHTMTYVCVMHLYPLDIMGLQAVNALLALIRQMTDQDFLFLDPVITACWSCLAKHLLCVLEETMKGEALGSGNDSASVATAEEEFQVVIDALNKLGNYFPIADRAQKLQAERDKLLPPTLPYNLS